MGEDLVEEVQHVPPPAAGRHDELRDAVVEQRADAVALLGEKPRQNSDELDQHLPLGRRRPSRNRPRG